eukprot:Awhi_evm3s3077
MTGESKVKHTLNVDFIDIRWKLKVHEFCASTIIFSVLGSPQTQSPKGLTLDNVHSDQGEEFKNEVLPNALARKGIFQTFTTPHSNHNSFVDNRNRTI